MSAASIEAQLNVPSLECPPTTDSTESLFPSTWRTAFYDEPPIDLSQVTCSSLNHFDLSNIPTDCAFALDGRDVPDGTDPIVTMPIDRDLECEVDQFPELHEVREL